MLVHWQCHTNCLCPALPYCVFGVSGCGGRFLCRLLVERKLSWLPPGVSTVYLLHNHSAQHTTQLSNWLVTAQCTFCCNLLSFCCSKLVAAQNRIHDTSLQIILPAATCGLFCLFTASCCCLHSQDTLTDANMQMYVHTRTHAHTPTCICIK